MEAKFYTALLILGLISTALAKGGHHKHHKHGDHDDDDHHGKRRGDDDKCPPLETYGDLSLKCTVKDHCGTVWCSTTLDGETVWLGLKIYRSQDPLSAKVSLKVPSRNFYWPYTLKSGDNIQVPGFPLTIKGVVDADLFLYLGTYKKSFEIGFKLSMILRSNVSEDVTVTGLKGKLPVKDRDGEDGDHDGDHEKYHDGDHEHRKGRCSRFASWFKRQPGGVKAVVVISAILGLSLVITALVYCCKKRRAKVVDTVKIKPPSYDDATTIKTKVPLEPLVNEE